MKRTILIIIFSALTTLNCISQDCYAITDFFDKTTLYIEAMSESQEGKIFRGSGFVVEQDSIRYVITNYHVINDTDYYSNATHSPKGPYHKIRVWSIYKNKKNYVDIPLTINGKINYYRNSYKNILTDLVAIKLPKQNSLIYNPIDFKDYKLTKSTILNVNTDVYISGFPSYSNGEVYNILLLAQTITPPNIDTSSDFTGRMGIIKTNKGGSGGLSGSPVFVWKDKMKPPVFVGVYSGCNAENNGFFWRTDIIEDLIENINN